MLKYYYIIISICNNKKIVTKNIENNNNKKNTKYFVKAGGIDHRLYSTISTGGGQCQQPVEINFYRRLALTTAYRKHFYRRWSMLIACRNGGHIKAARRPSKFSKSEGAPEVQIHAGRAAEIFCRASRSIAHRSPSSICRPSSFPSR